MRNSLSKILREKGLTLEELAEKISFPIKDLEEIYLGQREIPKKVLISVADYLDVSQEELLKDSRKTIYENIGQQLRQVREEKKLTLVELGKMAGVSYTHISEIERGKTCASLKTLEKLAKVLEISTSNFFQLEEDFTLGEKIRKLRIKQNLTQLQLAENIGVSLSLIGQIETDRVKPAMDTLQNIANVFGVSICYFLLSEQEEITLRQFKNADHDDNSLENFKTIFQHMENRDFTLVFDLVNLLQNHRLLCQQKPVDPQTNELLKIMALLSDEDKEFVVENARWVLKKANGNILEK